MNPKDTTAELANEMLRKVLSASSVPPPKPVFPRVPNPLVRGGSGFPPANLTWVKMGPQPDQIERWAASDQIYVYTRRMGPSGWVYSRRALESAPPPAPSLPPPVVVEDPDLHLSGCTVQITSEYVKFLMGDSTEVTLEPIEILQLAEEIVKRRYSRRGVST